MRSKQIPLIALALIILFGGFLRLYKLDFGLELPYVAHTDEPTQYNPAIRILTTGDLNPHFFNYPSLPIYLYSAVMRAGYLVGRLLGVYQSLADLQPVRTLQMSVGVYGTPQLLLLGRAASALFGTLTIGLVNLSTGGLPPQINLHMQISFGFMGFVTGISSLRWHWALNGRVIGALVGLIEALAGI